MRALATAATLLVGLAIVFLVPTANTAFAQGPPPSGGPLGNIEERLSTLEGQNLDPRLGIVESDTPGGVTGCAEGQVAKFVSGTWGCAADVDTLA